MSDEDKKKHSERLHQKETKLQKKMKLAKDFHMDHALQNPHKYHEKSLFNCGNPKCILCMNPRKGWHEKTMQERKFEQTEKLKDE